MNKLNTIILTIAIAILISCSDEKVAEISDESSAGKTPKTFDTVVSVSAPEKPYVNPVLIYGSSFGEFFQTLYKTGRFEDMLKFTSATSIDRFGRDSILSFYKGMDFAYSINLKSKNDSAGMTILNYEAGITATRKMLRINVIVENDSCKIVLKDLKDIR